MAKEIAKAGEYFPVKFGQSGAEEAALEGGWDDVQHMTYSIGLSNINHYWMSAPSVRFDHDQEAKSMQAHMVEIVAGSYVLPKVKIWFIAGQGYITSEEYDRVMNEY